MCHTHGLYHTGKSNIIEVDYIIGCAHDCQKCPQQSLPWSSLSCQSSGAVKGAAEGHFAAVEHLSLCRLISRLESTLMIHNIMHFQEYDTYHVISQCMCHEMHCCTSYTMCFQLRRGLAMQARRQLTSGRPPSERGCKQLGAPVIAVGLGLPTLIHPWQKSLCTHRRHHMYVVCMLLLGSSSCAHPDITIQP